MTLVILTGEIDISVGSVFAICGVVAGVLAKAGCRCRCVAVAACVVGAALGALNGALVAYVRHPVDRRHAGDDGGAARRAALGDGGRVGAGSAGELSVARPDAGGVSRRGRSARRSAADRRRSPGGCATSPPAARSTRPARTATPRVWPGSTPRCVKFAVFALAGALTGLAAVLNAVRFNQIPSNAGLGLEMKVIAAVVVGGAAIRGGRGSVAGTRARRRPARRHRSGAHVPRRQRVLGARDPGRDHPGRGRRSTRCAIGRMSRARRAPASGAGRDRSRASRALSERMSLATAVVPERRVDAARWRWRREIAALLRRSRRTSSRSATSSRSRGLSVELGLLAVALTPVIVTGGIDLSVGSMMGLAAVVFGAACTRLAPAAAGRGDRRARSSGWRGRRAECAARRAAATSRRSSSRSARSRCFAASPRA